MKSGCKYTNTRLWVQSRSVRHNGRACGWACMSQQPCLLVAFTVTHISRKRETHTEKEIGGPEVKPIWFIILITQVNGLKVSKYYFKVILALYYFFQAQIQLNSQKRNEPNNELFKWWKTFKWFVQKISELLFCHFFCVLLSCVLSVSHPLCRCSSLHPLHIFFVLNRWISTLTATNTLRCSPAISPSLPHSSSHLFWPSREALRAQYVAALTAQLSSINRSFHLT